MRATRRQVLSIVAAGGAAVVLSPLLRAADAAAAIPAVAEAEPIDRALWLTGDEERRTSHRLPGYLGATLDDRIAEIDRLSVPAHLRR